MWIKLLTSPFTVVEKRFYPAEEEEEEQRGNCENSKAHNNRPAPSVVLSRGIAGLYVCFCDGAGRDHLVLEDQGLMEQI